MDTDSRAPLSQDDWRQVAQLLGLSAREDEILGHMMHGMTDVAIAQALGISPNTVKTHISRLYRKLDVADRCGAVVRIFETYAKISYSRSGR